MPFNIQNMPTYINNIIRRQLVNLSTTFFFKFRKKIKNTSHPIFYENSGLKRIILKKNIPEFLVRLSIFGFPQFHQEVYKIHQTHALQGLHQFRLQGHFRHFLFRLP